MMIDVAEKWARLRRFAVHDVWDIELASLSLIRRLLVRIVRVGHLIVRGFREDELALHASALTFTTLLSLVPFLAFIVSLGKGFGAEEWLVGWVEGTFAEMPVKVQELVGTILKIVQNTNFLALGASSIFLLLVTVIRMLGSIELSFNRVWGVTTPRNLIRKVKDYISTLVVVLVFMVAATTFSMEGLLAGWVPFASLSDLFFKLTPLLSAWIALSFLYAFMPNTPPGEISTEFTERVYGRTPMGWAGRNSM